MDTINFESLLAQVEVKKSRARGNRLNKIANYIKGHKKCDRNQVAKFLFEEEFGTNPDLSGQDVEVLKARVKIYRDAVNVALGSSKASINANPDFGFTVAENDKGQIIVTELAEAAE